MRVPSSYHFPSDTHTALGSGSQEASVRSDTPLPKTSDGWAGRSSTDFQFGIGSDQYESDDNGRLRTRAQL